MLLKNDLLGSLYDCLTKKNLSSFEELGGTLYEHPQDSDYRCLFIESSKASKVLAVAHTDVVMWKEPRMSVDGKYINCPQLDDRLGVWVITCLLNGIVPKDMPYDVLLTDFEEKGKSTGVLFTPPEGKTYNWMFEFDRRGLGVVMYDYETPELKELVEKYGFKVEQGSFTDICVMDRLGCAGFNFGTAYHEEHTAKCHADLTELLQQVKQFNLFYRDNYNTHLVGGDGTKKREWRCDHLYTYAKNGDVDADKALPFQPSQIQSLK